MERNKVLAWYAFLLCPPLSHIYPSFPTWHSASRATLTGLASDVSTAKRPTGKIARAASTERLLFTGRGIVHPFGEKMIVLLGFLLFSLVRPILERKSIVREKTRLRECLEHFIFWVQGMSW